MGTYNQDRDRLIKRLKASLLLSITTGVIAILSLIVFISKNSEKKYHEGYYVGRSHQYVKDMDEYRSVHGDMQTYKFVKGYIDPIVKKEKNEILFTLSEGLIK